MTRTTRRFAALLVVALALFGIFASSAMAALEDAPTPTLGTSMTNPGWGVDAWWRGGWGNSAHPEFTLNPAPMDEAVDGYLIGFLYSVDRNLATGISPSADPLDYYRAAWPVATNAVGGTSTDHTIDMLGIYQNPPAGGWRAQLPEEHTPLEGQWYFHYKFFSNFKYQDNQWNIPFGIDQTPPRAVTGLDITTGLTSSTVTTWTAATRAHIVWDAGDLRGQYDDLAGIGYYQIMLDDKPYVPETSSSPSLGRVYASPVRVDGTPIFTVAPAFTIENMPAGAHKLSVVPVDRATNAGPAATQMFYSDPDTPTISFTSPAANVLTLKTVFSVDATDAAGPPVVTIALDGSTLTTLTAPPYSYKPDLTGLSSGTHTLTASATDHFGRKVTIHKQVGFNNTMTSSGFMTAGPSELVYVVPTASSSNPVGDRWRTDPLDALRVWTNDLHPDFTVPEGSEIATLLADAGGDFGGMLYEVRRVPQFIDATAPDRYFRTWRADSTHLDGTIDLASVMAYPPAGGWPAMEPGAEDPIEGTWYLQYKGFLTSGWAESATNVVKFGVDVTPPSTVDSLTASPTTATAMVGVVSAGTRTHVTWRTKDYDALSGVAYYQVLLDGEKVVPDEGDAQGRVFDLAGRAEPAATIENLTPGKHTIAVYAVDRAGNEGKSVSVHVYSDPDEPTISIAKPSGSLIGPKAIVAASCADEGGVRSVVFRLDGIAICSQASAPYSEGVDLTGFASGTHTLTATVTDMYGRTATATKSIKLDTTPLKISSFSRNYSLFYPIKRDGIRDDLKVSFKANKSCSVKVKITTSSGKLVRTISKSVSAGSTSLKWDGKWSEDHKAHTGTFYVQVTASDSAGNSTSSGKLKTSIRNYEVVKSSGNQVKIVAR